MTIINSNPGRETLITLSELTLILSVTTLGAYAVLGDSIIQQTPQVLTYMTVLGLGANALFGGLLKNGPGGKLKEAYSFHKL